MDTSTDTHEISVIPEPNGAGFRWYCSTCDSWGAWRLLENEAARRGKRHRRLGGI